MTYIIVELAGDTVSFLRLRCSFHLLGEKQQPVSRFIQLVMLFAEIVVPGIGRLFICGEVPEKSEKEPCDQKEKIAGRNPRERLTVNGIVKRGNVKAE